jgi:L-ascorbate metabolism protein UlaG (beta-lactamase superfamily)
MSNLGVKIHYLYHSGFAVEVHNNFLIFDYFKDTSEGLERNLSNGVISENDLINKENVYIFSSHSHYDHFNPIIFEWENHSKNIEYILSSEIEINDKKSNCHFMNPYESIMLGNISVTTYGSTDIGVSYLVSINDISIFHAGDLNWWCWKDDTNEEKTFAETGFITEIEKLSNKHIDISFFPVDPRQEELYCMGGEYFIEKVKPGYFIPMHFGDDFETTKTFSEKQANSSTKIIVINKRGQEISI